MIVPAQDVPETAGWVVADPQRRGGWTVRRDSPSEASPACAPNVMNRRVSVVKSDLNFRRRVTSVAPIALMARYVAETRGGGA